MEAKDILKAVMTEKNLNQRNLAKASGFTETSISRWLNGLRDPKVGDLVKVLKAVGYDIFVRNS